jgi:hypothetical protein
MDNYKTAGMWWSKPSTITKQLECGGQNHQGMFARGGLL